MGDSPKYIQVKVDIEQQGDQTIETVYVPANLKMEKGQVTKEIDPEGESVLIFDSRKEADEAIVSAGFTPYYSNK